MSAQSSLPPRSPRLILRAFATDTDRRFFLLIFAIFGSSLYIYRSLLTSLPLSSFYTHCIDNFLSHQAVNMASIDGLSAQCSGPLNLQLLLYILVGELLLFGMAFLVYWFLPSWRYRREQLVPLQKHEHPEYIDALEKLHQAYIPYIPLHYVWKEISSKSARVFGRLGKYYLFLPMNTLTRATDDPRGFCAIVLHEMSHIYNKDVNKTSFTIIIWYSFLVMALLPYIVFSIAIILLYPGGGTSFAVNGILRVGAMVLVVYLIRSAVLRSRELSADAQAADWGYAAELLQQINSLETGKGPFSFYPSHEQRIRNIEDPEQAFYLDFWDAFRIGVTFGMAFFSIHDTFSMLGQLFLAWGWSIGSIYAPDDPDIGTVVLCVLFVLLIGQMIWRAVLITRLRDQSMPSAGMLGLSLAAGLVLGFFLSLAFTPLAAAYLVNNWSLPIFYFVPWMLLLGIGMFFFCKWLALLASLWLEVVSGRWVQLVTYLNFVLAGLLLAVGCGFLSYSLLVTLGYLLPGATTLDELMHPIVLHALASASFYWRLTIQTFLLTFLLKPFVFLALVTLWALPLLSWFWSRKGHSRQRFQWAIADPVELARLPDSFSPLPTVLIALFGSALFLILLLPIRLSAAPSEAVSVIGPGGTALLVGSFLWPIAFSPFLLAALFQASVAAIIIRRTRAAGVVPGIFGACLSGSGMAVGTIIIYHFIGGLGPDGPRFIFLYEVNWGMVCTLGMVIVIVMLRSLSRPPFQLMEMLKHGGSAQGKRYLLIFLACLLLIGILIFLSIFANVVPGARQQATTNIVQNADFEEPVLLDTSAQYSLGQSFGNWIVSSGTVSLIGSRWIPAHGAQSMTLNGSGAGSIRQDLVTQPGSNYTLSFAMAGNPACTSVTTKIQVWWNTTIVASPFSNTGNSTWGAVGWQYHTYHVHATSTLTHLSFISLTQSTCGPTLDDVTVARTAAG